MTYVRRKLDEIELGARLLWAIGGAVAGFALGSLMMIVMMAVGT